MNYHRLFATSLLLAFSALLASCAERSQMPAKGFEGTITEKIQIVGLGDVLAQKGDSSGEESSMANAIAGSFANIGLRLYVRENKVASDISMLGGLVTLHSIIDRNARTITTLRPNHTAVVTDLRALDTMRERIDDSLKSHSDILDSLQAIIPQPTGKHQTIHDMDAEQYIGRKGPVETEMWLSSNDKIKAFDIVRDAFLGRGTEGVGTLDQVFGMMRPVAGKIPLKFETRINGKVFAKGELTDIDEEHVDDAIFEIPKDYTIVKPEHVRVMPDSARVKGDSIPAKPHRGITAP